jgi:hypothetical protein|tara:strand:+ start:565 stop:1002 length:438 start_codon:yes stop_codon:yes gene_type:complete
MGIKKIKQYENAVTSILNLDGWDLKTPDNDFTVYDAIGYTPKRDKKGNRIKCVIEMKFRNKYYPTKMLEKDKYDALMSLGKDVVKIFYVFDTKGNFMYFLNTLKLPKLIKKTCPDKTMWTKNRIQKDVYMLNENDAVRINLNQKE